MYSCDVPQILPFQDEGEVYTYLELLQTANLCIQRHFYKLYTHELVMHLSDMHTIQHAHICMHPINTCQKGNHRECLSCATWYCRCVRNDYIYMDYFKYICTLLYVWYICVPVESQTINFTLRSSLNGVDFGLVQNGVIFYDCLMLER